MWQIVGEGADYRESIQDCTTQSGYDLAVGLHGCPHWDRYLAGDQQSRYRRLQWQGPRLDRDCLWCHKTAAEQVDISRAR